MGDERSPSLPPHFYARETPVVARELLGQRLVRVDNAGKRHESLITETEAYHGPEDRACHAHKGETARTNVMFGEPGHWYVYLCYGVHWMLNIVTGPAGFPSAVLLRGSTLITGPGRLTRQLWVDGQLNRSPALPGSGLWIEPGESVPARHIEAGPRIGIAYAGEPWVSKPWRFVWTDRWSAPAKR